MGASEVYLFVLIYLWILVIIVWNFGDIYFVPNTDMLLLPISLLCRAIIDNYSFILSELEKYKGLDDPVHVNGSVSGQRTR